jgi:type I restriction enzyme S subunit
MREATVEEITDAIIDYRGKTPPKASRGIPLLTAKVIKDGTIDDSRLEFISEETYGSWMRRGFPRRRDILLTTEAPLGETAILRGDDRVALAQRVVLLRGNPTLIDQDYFFAALRSPLVQDRLRQRATGTTVLGIKQRELRQVLIPLPPLEIQHKIAAIVTAYDDLIENNSRRILILQEIARRIYREWFVDLRYPGHEAVSLVGSELGPIPRGWHVVALNEVTTIDKGLSYKGAFLTGDGLPMANLKCLLPDGGFRRDGTKPYSGETKSKHRVMPGDVIVANTDLTQAGAVIGSPAIIPRRGFEHGGLASHHLFVMRPSARHLAPAYLFHVLADERFRGFARGRASGTTVLGFRAADCGDYRFALPPAELLERFTHTADATIGLCERLHEAIEAASVTRDLLLPRLISGEIDLADRDILVPDLAA